MNKIALTAATLAVAFFSAQLTAISPAAAPTPGSPASVSAGDKDGFVSLFNGRDLDGWKGKPGVWSVVDGTITGVSTPQMPCEKATYLIWQGKPAGDFELRLSYRLDAGNSGINFRSRELPDNEIAGYQADIEAGPNYTGIIYEVCGREIMSTRGQKMVVDADGTKHVTQVADPNELGKVIKTGQDWNDYRIVARGNHITLSINGRVITELIDNLKTVPREGTFSLQVHPGPFMKVQYKDIRLKRFE